MRYLPLVMCAAISLTLAPVLALPADQPTQRLIDVRDLGATMESDRLMMIVTRVGEALGVHVHMIDDGLIIVSGDDATLDTFNEMMFRLRALYEDTYTFELRSVAVPVDEAPRVGTSFDDGRLLFMTSQTVTRRVATSISSTHQRTYLSDVQPVVGNQAVGFDPRTEEAESGIAAEVVIGAGNESDESTIVAVRGQIVQTEINLFKPGHDSSALPQMPSVEMPTSHVRSFNATRRLSFGQRTVLAVLDGLKGDEVIVLTGRVVDDGP